METLGISRMEAGLRYYQPTAKQISSKDLGDYIREKWYLMVEPTVPLLYEVAGIPERCELFVGEGGHRYYKKGAWPFIQKWFEAEED